MAVHFLDTSALVKRYVAESGSATVDALIHAHAGDLFIAAITAVEVAAAITRRADGGFLSLDVAEEIISVFRVHRLTEYRIVRITHRVVTKGMDLAQSRGLRGYDAVQLACAVELLSNSLKPELHGVTLVSADTELNVAARLGGFTVLDPNV